MSRFKNKKKTSIIAIFMVLSVAGAAFAYWTVSGDGSGTAATGSVEEDLVVNQVSTPTNLRPGGAAETLSGDFDNPNDEPVFVTSVTAAIESVTGGAGACTAADYTLANAVMTVDAEVPVGDGVGDWTGATIQFDNDPLANQDGCQGATVNIAYTVQSV